MHEIHDYSSRKKTLQEYVDRFAILKEKSGIADEGAYYLFQTGLPHLSLGISYPTTQLHLAAIKPSKIGSYNMHKTRRSAKEY